MKRLIGIITASAIFVSLLPAQNNRTASTFDEFSRRKKEEFIQFREQKRTEFEQFRQRLNAEYAAMIAGKWDSYSRQPEKKPLSQPKPASPRKADPKAKPGTVTPGAVMPPEKKIPDVPVSLPKPAKTSRTYPIKFTFFNTPCGIEKFDTSLLQLTASDNASLSKAWHRLTADGACDTLIDDCLRLREEMTLCDWGFLLLVEKVAQTLYPKNANAQAFLTVALLNQCGYDTRLATSGSRVVAMFHPSHTIYWHSYYTIEGKTYYLRKAEGLKNIYTYNGDYRKSPTPIRMIMDRYPSLSPSAARQRQFSSERWDDAPPIHTEVNSSVIDFLNSYPVTDWHLYSLAPVSDALRTSIFPAMQVLTEGLSPVEAVDLILRFHYRAFQYMTDGDQFGREKPYFFDENYFYPYNDCEDRAIMFSRIVKDVLGFDVVLLKYPNHLAAAVRFPAGTKISGTTVSVDGQRYYVCDPTCGAMKAGYLHPIYSTSNPTVYRIMQ